MTTRKDPPSKMSAVAAVRGEVGTGTKRMHRAAASLLAMVAAIFVSCAPRAPSLSVPSGPHSVILRIDWESGAVHYAPTMLAVGDSSFARFVAVVGVPAAIPAAEVVDCYRSRTVLGVVEAGWRVPWAWLKDLPEGGSGVVPVSGH